jgi:16S rRNA processing protein RimM
MHQDNKAAVLLARIGAAHGVRGEVRVKSFTADPTALGNYGPLISGDGRTFVVERLRPAKEVVIVKFRGIGDRNRRGGVEWDRSVRGAREPPGGEDEDEFYHADLIGLAAETETGEPLGALIAIHNFGAGDILEIAPQRGASLLVPFTKAAVPAIDIAARRIVVSPPEEATTATDRKPWRARNDRCCWNAACASPKHARVASARCRLS